MKPFTACSAPPPGPTPPTRWRSPPLPLTATLVLGAGPDLLGLLVAAQSAALAVVSLPAGTWIDRMPRRRMLIVALALGLTASLAAVAAAATRPGVPAGPCRHRRCIGHRRLCPDVGLVVAEPGAGGRPARANARLELARAVVSLAAPFVAGLLAQHLSPTWGYALAALGAALALVCVLALPKGAAPTAETGRPGFANAIRIGAVFVVRNELLRGISLCAIFWNFAFFALLAVWAPLALGPLGLDPAHMGLAQSTYGAGLILGARGAGQRAAAAAVRDPDLRAGRIDHRRDSFLAAPSGSGLILAAAGYFLVGFGPMLWAILQTTVRQLVTPSPLMGRVNATVQTAIYGVQIAGRPGRRLRGGTGRPARRAP